MVQLYPLSVTNFEVYHRLKKVLIFVYKSAVLQRYTVTSKNSKPCAAYFITYVVIRKHYFNTLSRGSFCSQFANLCNTLVSLCIKSQ